MHKTYTLSLPVSLGFVCSFLAAIGTCKLKKLMNSRGVIDSNGVFSHYLVPSFFAAVVSLQMLGIGLAFGCGVIAAIFLGLFLVFMKFRTANDQFSSSACVGIDDNRKNN